MLDLKLMDNRGPATIKKAILRGKLSVNFIPPSSNQPVPPPDSPVGPIERYLGLEGRTPDDRVILSVAWREGKVGLLKLFPLVPMRVINQQMEVLENDLGACRRGKERLTAGECFLLRYGSHHTDQVWAKCLELSRIWTPEVLAKVDLGAKHNWPGLFVNILCEYDSQCNPWAEAALSLFYNAILTIKGPEFAREFTAHLICLLLKHDRVFALRASKFLLKSLQSLMVRTYLPSIFAASYAGCVKIHLKLAQIIR